ncbi:hypothetical protein UFOVP399_30 [uncultured Caudovirales phage]|uniref:Uncharacterized protein n=1 Tax=uncultured Caudovirales phage TaxID=2100421 RepID=A0A6J5M2J2_9CAUD|nr:hypothetical protein UFOVP399_30 [uncultured Caudovirales phage]
MMQQQMPPQGGNDIFSEIGALVEQLVQMAGPEAVLAMLQQAGAQQQMPPEVMPLAAPMPAKRGMMGRRIN